MKGGSTDPRLDVKGRPVTAVGGWNVPSNLFQLRAAVTYLHEKSYPETCGGTYVVSCAACMAANSDTSTATTNTGTAVVVPEVENADDVEEELTVGLDIFRHTGWFR